MSGSGNGFIATYKGVLQLFASAAAVSVFIVFYGFFSEATTFQFMGLPMLSADFKGLLEAGGRALVDSFAALGWVRGLFGIGVLLAIRCLWVLRDRHLWLARRCQAPVLLIIAQYALLAVLAVLVWTQIEYSQLASSRGPDLLRERAEHTLATLRSQGQLEPRIEQEALEALTYQARPLRGLYERLAAPFSRDRGSPCRENERVATDTSVGVPLRANACARNQARNQFGWLLFWSLLLMFSVAGVRCWRTWLETRVPVAWRERKTIEAAELEASIDDGAGHTRHRRYNTVFASSRALIEPALILLVAGSLSLMPSSYGLLARDSLGMQAVMVRLLPINADGKPCAPSPALSWAGPGWHQGLLPSADDGPARSIPRSPIAQRECDWHDIQKLQDQMTSFREHWRDFVQLRPFEEGLDGYTIRLNKLRNATDQLVTEVVRLACPTAWRVLWLMLPATGEFQVAPDAAEYVLSRWSDAAQNHSSLLFGHLLTYPRGEDSNQLSIFHMLDAGRSTQPTRALVRTVPRTCVAAIELQPDPRQVEIARIEAQIQSHPGSERIQDLLLYPGNHAMTSALRLHALKALNADRQGMLITLIGTLARVLGTEHAALRQEASERLVEVIWEDLCALDLPESARPARCQSKGGPASGSHSDRWDRETNSRAALSSLHLVGGAYAMAILFKPEPAVAGRIGPSITDILADPDRLRRRGELITTLGFLANDVVRDLQDLPERSDSDIRIRLRDQASEWLRKVVTDSRHTTSNRATACTSLGRAINPLADEAIESMLLDLFDPRSGETERDKTINEQLAAACLSQTPARHSRRTREILRRIATGEIDGLGAARGRLADLALIELYEAGLSGEAELATEILMRSPDNSGLNPLLVLGLLSEFDRDELRPRLEHCRNDATSSDSARENCRKALRELDSTQSEATSPGTSRERIEPLPDSEPTSAIDRLRQHRDAGDEIRFTLAALTATTTGDDTASVEAYLSEVVREAFEPGISAGAPFPPRALRALMTSPARHAELMAEVYIGANAGPLVFIAAQYLEDGPAPPLAQRLLDCTQATQPEQPVLTRRRCVLGLALLEESWQPSNTQLTVLRDLLIREQALTLELCLLGSELALRGAEWPDASACAFGPLKELQQAGEDVHRRWWLHLRSLLGLLRQDAGTRNDERAISVLDGIAEEVAQQLDRSPGP